jgi:hypothetical protein
MADVLYMGRIQGRVPLRPGETRQQAVARAQDTLNALLTASARRLRPEVTLAEIVPQPSREAA